MSSDAKTVGDKWGALFGLLVDACQSHHASPPDHTLPIIINPGQKEKTDTTGTTGTAGQIHGITVSASPGCKQTWTKKNGQIQVPYESTVALMQLANPSMFLLAAGDDLSTGGHDAPLTAAQLNGIGSHDVEITLDDQLPRGLYVGALRPATNNPGTSEPILIYIDDVVI